VTPNQAFKGRLAKGISENRVESVRENRSNLAISLDKCIQMYYNSYLIGIYNMLTIKALWVDDDVLDKIEGRHGLKFLDIEEALVYS